MTPPRVTDASGRPVALGVELARGGEGAVFELPGRPDSVAKIYLQSPDREQGDKIAAMVAMATPRLTALCAWPTAPLFGARGTVVGYVMPRLGAHRPVFQAYGPRLRLRQFPRADWRFLVHVAGNVARAFHAVHGAGLVVGDVNQSSLFVAQDATVRFIDTDSMQVKSGGRTWLCKVGTSTHQPPEMQGLESYGGIVRTPNHDAFGMAVTLFQLLCIGRHPFAGRYAGPGEPPPIDAAIAHSRYAYSLDVRRTAMTPPPGSLPMTALPPDIRDLFEDAFAPKAALGGRPAAERWVTSLTELGSSLRSCSVNAAHWFAPAVGACPWCVLEGASGAALFPAVYVPSPAGGGVVLLWNEVAAVPDPGPIPALGRPGPASVPSASVRAAARRLARRRGAAAVLLGGGCLALLAALRPGDWPLPLAMLAGAAAWLWFGGRSVEGDEVRRRLAEMRAQWSKLEARWSSGPAAQFAATRQRLTGLKREFDAMPQQRLKEVHNLSAHRREQQMRTHLESFEIATARVPGIGRAKAATLLSYGVETAADIDRNRVMSVPGFGPVSVEALLGFRRVCEASFVFDGARGASPAQVSAVDGMLAQRQGRIEVELAAGLAQLRTMAAAERRHRAALQAAAEELRPILAQLQADARALRVG